VRGHLAIPDEVKDDVMAVYTLIAEAESHAHGVPVTQIHFHEVGTMDAIADITAVCLLMHKLAPDEVVVSPIHVGSGQVHCAHGVLPVPAPATAFILKDVPMYGGSVRGELCTPTGAALLKHFATRFGAMPVMRTQAIGYGMGKKDFEAANCVRVLLGETETGTVAGSEDKAAGRAADVAADGQGGRTETLLELACNVDDMTAEQLGYAMERLLEGGARDVYTTPIGMKKCRPGTMLCVLCAEADRERMVRLMFAHTTTLGVRETVMRRYVLDRSERTVQLACGTMRKKISSGYGVERVKYEYEDLARIAREQKISILEAKEIVETCCR